MPKITDEEIRELRTAVRGMTVAPHVEALCDLALGSTEEARIVLSLHPRHQKHARARCAAFRAEMLAARPRSNDHGTRHR